ncbi:hypothetical protein, partial [Pseudomonas sp. LF090]
MYQLHQVDAIAGKPAPTQASLAQGSSHIFCRSSFQVNVAKIYNPAAFTASLRTSAMPTTAFYKS